VQLPPLFEDRPFALQLVGGIVVPAVFGLFTGFVLGWNEIAYLILVGPIGIGGGFLAGIEHRGGESGFVRGIMGGLVFGSFILLGHEIANVEPKADLPDPQGGLVFVTTFFGAILGALGGRFRVRKERQLEAAGALAAE
jgi:hypothetical protein